MNILVHLMLARRVCRFIRAQTGVELDEAGFLFGNVLPDLSEEYDAHPHFQWESMPFVLERIAALCDGAENSPIHSFTFAKEVGVIAHYLSDFCCYAHSARFEGGILRHHRYEWRMLSRFADGAVRFAMCSPEFCDTPGAFDVFLARVLNQYHEAPPDGATDVFYALRTSAAVAMLSLSRVRGREAALFLPCGQPVYPLIRGGEVE